MKHMINFGLSLFLATAIGSFTSTPTIAANDKLNQTFDGGWNSGDIEFRCKSSTSEFNLIVKDGKAQILVDGEAQPAHSIRYSPEIVVYLSGTREQGMAYAVHFGKREFSYQSYGPEFMEYGEEVILDCPLHRSGSKFLNSFELFYKWVSTAY